ncbi:CorA family divalent cation transporter [Halochromatium sp.]
MTETEDTTNLQRSPLIKPRYQNWFGLICAYQLDGRGGGTPLTWKDLEPSAESGKGLWTWAGPGPIASQRPSLARGSASAPASARDPDLGAGAGTLWVHIDVKHSNAQHWLRSHSGLDAVTQDALTAARVSPRLEEHNGGMLLILKGLNFAPRALPTDLVALRLWSDGQRVLTCRREHVRAPVQLRHDLNEGCGPTDASSLIATLSDLMVANMEDLIIEQVQSTHQIGRLGDAKPTEDLVSELAHLRRVMIWMRRSLGPQRRALARLAASPATWMSDADRALVREVAHQCTEYVEGLDAAQEIGEITQDEILQRSTEKTERRLFSLTVITAVFLPLTFITGLLGVNLAGIPDANDPWSFLILVVFLIGLVAAQIWLLHRKGWL